MLISYMKINIVYVEMIYVEVKEFEWIMWNEIH